MAEVKSFAEVVRSGLKPEEALIQLPNLAILVMGASGVGKTHFLGTAEKPLLVQQFDPSDKASTYENLGFIPDRIAAGKWCDIQYFYSPRGPDRPVIAVEHFHEDNPRNAKVFDRYMARMNDIEKDLRADEIRTVGLDSLTFFELAARFYNKYTFHPTNKRGEMVQDEKLHYAASARMVEEFITSRYPGLQRICNVVIIAHIQSETFDDAGENEDQREERKTLAAPGKQVRKIPAALSEVYRLYVDAKGNHWLQTAPRPGQNNFECKSVRQVPDPTVAHWKALTKYLKERYEKRLAALTAEEPTTKNQGGPNG